MISLILLPIPLAGAGHFYLAAGRTFLLVADKNAAMIAAKPLARIVALAAPLLVTSSAWAYGGWQPMSFWQAFGLVMGWWLFPGLAAFVALYVVFSFWMEKTRYTVLIPLLLHLMASALVATPLSAVMGATGPAHLVCDLNMLTFAIFCVLLWVKAIVLTGWCEHKQRLALKASKDVATGGHPEGA